MMLSYLLYLWVADSNLPQAVTYFFASNITIFMYLFTDFYLKTYKQKKAWELKYIVKNLLTYVVNFDKWQIITIWRKYSITTTHRRWRTVYGSGWATAQTLYNLNLFAAEHHIVLFRSITIIVSWIKC